MFIAAVVCCGNFVEADDMNPSWSYDGTKIAFNSGNEIYTMNTDGSNQTRLTNNSSVDNNPSWKQSTRIAFTSNRDGNYEVYVMDVDGSNQTNLTNNSEPDNSPHLQPRP